LGPLSLPHAAATSRLAHAAADQASERAFVVFVFMMLDLTGAR
jgi:hypothetical protein